jgi:hypothetical protein
MRPRVAEVRAVAAALAGEFDSAEEAATAAILAYEDAKADRLVYGVAVQAQPVPRIYYSFDNSTEALRWAARYGLDAVEQQLYVLPLVHAQRAEKRHQEAMAEVLKARELEHPTPGRRKRK